MSERTANNPADPWSMNPWAPPAGQPAPVLPHERKAPRPIPDQRELFSIQKTMQRLEGEISNEDMDGIRREFGAAWKKLNRYLKEHATA